MFNFFFPLSFRCNSYMKLIRTLIRIPKSNQKHLIIDKHLDNIYLRFMKPNIPIIPYFIFVKVLDKKICRIFFHLHVSKSAYYNAKEFFTSKCGKINVTKKCPAFNHVDFLWLQFLKLLKI